MKKRIISLLLAALLIVSLLPTMALAVDYTDTHGHWGERPIDRWSDYGVVAGKGNGIFDPDGFMTRAEAAQVFANLFRLTAKADLSDYIDVGLGKWYDDAIAKCVAAGILSGKGEGVMDPEGTITREEFFVMFARALGIEPETEAKVAVADGAQAASWAVGYITTLVNRGFIKGTGSADGGIVVQPKLNINRAGVMSLLDQAIDTYVNTTEKVTAGDGLTLIVADNANVTFAEDTENAEVYVFGNNAVITNAPVGTVVTTSDGATGTTVNGKAVSKDTTTVVEKEKPSGGSYTPPVPTTYTVTFDLNGITGEAPEAQTITSGKKVTEPADPTDTVHTFDGWYKTKDATTGKLSDKWSFETDTVTANMTLYAQWTRTIASIIGTNQEFPAPTTDPNTPPANAWVNGQNPDCKAFVRTSTNGDALYLKKTNESKNSYFTLSDAFTKVNDNYEFEGEDYKASLFRDYS